MNKLFLKRKEQFIKYAQKLDLNMNFKGYLIDDNFISRNPSIYLFYPEIFSHALVSDVKVEKTRIQQLNIAGFLFYKSLLEIDTVIDKTNLSNPKSAEKHVLPILSSVCQEESIKLLTTVFPIKSIFWKIWGQRREEYIQALLLDKKMPDSLSLSQFEDYADYKSAFGKIAIDSVHILGGSKKKTSYKALIESHRNFSIALQLLDDIIDFKEDLENPQINFAILSLKNELKKKNIDVSTLDQKMLAKHLYVQGVAKQIITLSIEYLYKATRKIANENLPIWHSVIGKKIKEAQMMLTHINAYEKTINAKIILSNRTINSDSLDLPTRINKSIEFIIKNQNHDGSWSDFYNKAGLSNVWTTGFIVSNIQDSLTNYNTGSLNNAISFLNTNRQGDLWGYNTNWIEDTDSTTFVLSALTSMGYKQDKELQKWISQQRQDGGYSTYSKKDKLLILLGNEFNNVDGWTQSHACVSSAVLFSMTKMGCDHISQFKKLLEYMRRSQKINYLWDAYWWTSDIYATSYALRSFLMAGYNLKDKFIINSLDAIAKTQNKDGSYSTILNESSAFFTSLALSAFSFSTDTYNAFKNNADMALDWLLKNQYEDGSFPDSYSLKIPAAHVTDPSSVNWQKSYKQSSNVVINDFMRLFSTASTLHALNSYSSVMQTK